MKNLEKNLCIVKPEYNDHPWGLKKVAVVLRWMLFRGYFSKISIRYGWMGFWLVLVDRWPLFRGGC
jgi:hypothetical protein